MQQKVTDLSGEMMDLKKCQIDILKIAIAVFTAVSSIVLAFYKHCSPLDVFDNDGSICHHEIWTLLGLVTIIPVLFPYLSWIIIYKSRSLFRISSYIRLLEHFEVVPSPARGVNVQDLNYEKLYREMRNDAWLQKRFTRSAVLNYLSRWVPYFVWKRRYIGVYQYDVDNTYKGGFYSRVLRFIWYITTAYSIGGLVISSWFIDHVTDSSKYSLYSSEVRWFGVYIVWISGYWLYNMILLVRYNSELLDMPFSQDAQYQMWIRAYERIAGCQVVEKRGLAGRERVKGKWLVTLKTGRWTRIEGQVKNISVEGAAISSAEPVPGGKELDIRIAVDEKQAVEVKGRRVWVRARRSGKKQKITSGLRFKEVTPTDRMALCRLMGGA
ncbi:MAG: PilZ domain-containing protein [Thermodesulfobacteriota bacterium]|nr:PilZ domain-containing protein [Thermodesulfobacteriota bacterium]